ncbi:hypothetical protein [Salinigranum sp. GCM10025319]|uniref:hypothetical protein n=1 Tax=Salinigranum sp. GCM10025319 TaxID=3252687 RepID=UPI003618C6E9
MTLLKDLSPSRATLGVIGLLLVGIILGWVLHSADSVSGPEVASIWTSVVLTLFLAYIYSRQNEILELQSQIMGGSHTPILSVSNLAFTNEEPESGNALQISDGGEFFSFSVVNEGNDIAVGLSILYIPTFVLTSQSTTQEDIAVPEDVVVDEIPPNEDAYPFADDSIPPHLAREFPVHSTKIATEASDIKGATVPTEEGPSEMYAQAGFYVLEQGQRKPIGFARGIQQLLNDDSIQAVIVGRVLMYQNPFEEPSHIVLPALRFDEGTLDTTSDSPLDATVERRESYYTNRQYRVQMSGCAEAYLNGNDIIYFQAT